MHAAWMTTESYHDGASNTEPSQSDEQLTLTHRLKHWIKVRLVRE